MRFKKRIACIQALRTEKICFTLVEYKKHTQDLLKRFMHNQYAQPNQ